MQVDKLSNKTFGINKTNSFRVLDNLNKKHILRYEKCKDAEKYNQELWNQISDSCLVEEKNLSKDKKHTSLLHNFLNKIQKFFTK